MKIGAKYLLTTDRWFYAPDGEQYRAVFGTVHEILDAEAVLGIKTNRNSTNWYVLIGDMVVAGCQVFYAIRTEDYDASPPTAEVDHEGVRHVQSAGITRIYDADASGQTHPGLGVSS